jgi:YidC/Oxa1 family membrane protein insertase
MFSTIWHTFFFDPIYNALIFFINHIPGGDVGVAIIFLSIVVKLLLVPISLKAARTQHAMRDIEPELRAIKERNKGNRENEARETLELYRTSGVSPFISIILLFIQVPILIALYLSVSSGGGVPLPDINTSLLYNAIPTPETVNMLLLGVLDMAKRSLPLAILAGVTQFLHASISMGPVPKAQSEKPSFKEDFTRSMHLQMRYVMPLLIVFFAFTISASVALYFTISNLLNIAQEYYLKTQRATFTTTKKV